MKKIRNSFLLVATALLLFSCGEPEVKRTKPYIVTTTGMIADAVKNITDTLFDVEALMGPGVDPHLYKTKQSDTKKLMEADAVFYNGVHLEGRMSETLEELAKTKKVFSLEHGIPESKLIKSAGFVGSHDPHIWFDVKIWIGAVSYIKHELQKLYPQHAQVFQKNADAYIAKLKTFDEWVETELSTIPENTRVLITAHDAFGYFGKAYNIKVKGLQGISTASDYGVNDRIRLVNFICDQKIKAVFVESSVSPKSINAIIEDCAAKGHVVQKGGELFSDAMGAAGTAEGTYIGMLQHNVNTIVKGLK
jgi:manganese/zinc/iron transport system substrate-binding protein